jgi:hypothetical protein
MDVVSLFQGQVPELLCRDLASGVQEIYSRTEDLCEEILLHHEERRNLRPWLRRSLMEQMLRGIVELHPGVATLYSQVDESGFWNHVMLKCGRFWITQHTQPDDTSALSPAGYKLEAASLNQMLLFPDSHMPVVGEELGDLYAVLVHGRAADNSVGFAKIKFPLPNVADGFFPGEIDLIAAFPEIFASPEPGAVEEFIPEPSVPVILVQNDVGA